MSLKAAREDPLAKKGKQARRHAGHAETLHVLKELCPVTVSGMRVVVPCVEVARHG